MYREIREPRTMFTRDVSHFRHNLIIIKIFLNVYSISFSFSSSFLLFKVDIFGLQIIKYLSHDNKLHFSVKFDFIKY